MCAFKHQTAQGTAQSKHFLEGVCVWEWVTWYLRVSLNVTSLKFVVKPFLGVWWWHWERSTFCTGKLSGLLLEHHSVCSPICFRISKKKKKEKGNKEINQNNAKGKHQPENSMFFVMLFLWGHLLLAIRLNHWNLPWSYICHCLHFPTSVIN